MFELTDKDFRLFKKYCKEAVLQFQLNDWDLDFKFDEINSNSKGATLATCGHSSGSAKMAEITLNVYWCKRPNKKRLRYTAYHEVLHLLMADAYNVAMDVELGFSQKSEKLDECVHACINRLLPLLCKNLLEEDMPEQRKGDNNKKKGK